MPLIMEINEWENWPILQLCCGLLFENIWWTAEESNLVNPLHQCASGGELMEGGALPESLRSDQQINNGLRFEPNKTIPDA